MFQRASRMNLPPYPFAELARLKKEALANGADLVDLGIGDPDLATPDFILDALAKYSRDPFTHHYDEPGNGLPEFRQAVAEWYEQRFGVKVDADANVLALIGSKEGIAHLPWVYIESGDVTLVPDPGYPVYRSSTTFAGGEFYPMGLRREADFLPDYSEIPADIADKARLMWLNYPNNPTGALADADFYQETADFASENNIIVGCDMAYSELAYDGEKPVSFLQAQGGLEYGIEFHSFSKTFSMTGWRIGFAVGNEELIAGLTKLKSNIDSGLFRAIQLACLDGLKDDHGYIQQMIARYQKRRDILCSGLKEAGFDVFVPKGAFYVWMAIPEGYTSADFAGRMLRECGILCTPGSAYGKFGEGYIRMALTLEAEDPEGRLREAVARVKRVFG